MWEAVQLPRETDAPEETERLIQQFAEEKIQSTAQQNDFNEDEEHDV